jgi:hypothetical protein
MRNTCFSREHGEVGFGPTTWYSIMQEDEDIHSKNFCNLTMRPLDLFPESSYPLCHLMQRPGSFLFPPKFCAFKLTVSSFSKLKT